MVNHYATVTLSGAALLGEKRTGGFHPVSSQYLTEKSTKGRLGYWGDARRRQSPQHSQPKLNKQSSPPPKFIQSRLTPCNGLKWRPAQSKAAKAKPLNHKNRELRRSSLIGWPILSLDGICVCFWGALQAVKTARNGRFSDILVVMVDQHQIVSWHFNPPDPFESKLNSDLIYVRHVTNAPLRVTLHQ